MDDRLLGRSGLKVSSLSIGAATIGGSGLRGDTDTRMTKADLSLRAPSSRRKNGKSPGSDPRASVSDATVSS